MNRDIKPVPPDASLLNSSEAIDTSILDNETANALQDESSAGSTGRRVAHATLGIGLFQVLARLVGFVSQPLIANRLGLQSTADVYTVATDIVTGIWRFYEKVVNPTFLPCFIAALREDGEERAWRFTSTALWLTLGALIVTTGGAWVLMPKIVDLYSDKAQAYQRLLTVDIARTLLLGLMFLGVSSLTYVILNGYKRFVYAALGDTLWKVGVLLGAAAAVGLHLGPERALRFIAFGFLIGSVLKLLPHVLALKSKWHLLRPRIDLRDPLIQKMLWLGVPLLVGIIVSEGRDVVIKHLADSPTIDVAGSRTALKFSRTIGDALIQTFPYALSIGIFPYLAELSHSRDTEKLTRTLISALRACIWTFAPITMILIALRIPLLSGVWESGKFTHQDTFALSLPFVYYCLGLVGFACEMILNQTFYAMTNVWVPTILGLITTALNIALAYAGVNAHWGLAGIAGAESFSKSVKCVILWMMLRKHLGDVRGKENFLFLLKVLAGSVVAAGVAWFLARHLAPHSGMPVHGHKLRMLLAVAVSGGLGMAAFALWSRLTKMEEFQVLGRLGKKLGLAGS